MNVFGIELRRTSVKDLYNDVDMVLSKFNMKEMERGAVAHALQDMFSADKFFSVCTIKECSKVSGVIITQERMNIYNSQHCIAWSAMLPEFRQVLIAMILDDFRSVLNKESKR